MVKKIKEKGEKKRKIIRDHAKNELVIHGVNSLSLRKISADLGISHGNLHYYFKTKDHLLLDIFNEEINKLNKSISNCSDESLSVEENAKLFLNPTKVYFRNYTIVICNFMFGLIELKL